MSGTESAKSRFVGHSHLYVGFADATMVFNSWEVRRPDISIKGTIQQAGSFQVIEARAVEQMRQNKRGCLEQLR